MSIPPPPRRQRWDQTPAAWGVFLAFLSLVVLVLVVAPAVRALGEPVGRGGGDAPAGVTVAFPTADPVFAQAARAQIAFYAPTPSPTPPPPMPTAVPTIPMAVCGIGTKPGETCRWGQPTPLPPTPLPRCATPAPGTRCVWVATPVPTGHQGAVR